MQQPLLFEIGWEVCWQLGGIYTVLRSKIPAMLERWGERYFLIGPYNPQTAAAEFEEQADGRVYPRNAGSGARPWELGAISAAGSRRAGRTSFCWTIAGEFSNLDRDKYLLWKDHGISTVAAMGR
jgi:glycogen(starch) synthase